MFRNRRLLALLPLLMLGSAAAETALGVQEAVWSPDGTSVDLKLKVEGLTPEAQLSVSVTGNSSRSKGARGTGIYSKAEPQLVSFKVDVPPGKAWQKLPITISGFAENKTAQLELPAPEGNLYVLAVGVKTFGGADSEFPDLEYTINDARELNKVLLTQEGRQFRKVIPYLLLDEQATRKNVLAAMKEIQQKATPNDTVVAFFSSHGTVAERDGSTDKDYYTMLYKGHKDNFKTTALHMDELRNFYTGVQAKMMLLLDTCDSGTAVIGAGVNQYSIREAVYSGLEGDGATRGKSGSKGKGAASESRVFIAAAGKTQESWEEAKLGHGIFTYAMLEALQGKFDPDTALGAGLDPSLKRDNLQVSQVTAYVVERVKKLGASFGYAQDPVSNIIPLSFPIAQFSINITINIYNITPSVIMPPIDPIAGVFLRSNGGKDTNTGSEAAPVQTLAKALSIQGARKMTVGAGEYTLPAGEYSLPQNGIILMENVKIRAQGGPVTLRCAPDGNGLSVRVGATLEGLRLVGCDVALSAYAGQLEVNDSEFDSNGQAAALVGGRSVFRRTIFRENGGGTSPAVSVRQDASLTVEGGIFKNNDMEALKADGKAHMTVNNVNFENNGRRSPNGGHIFMYGSANLDLEQSNFIGSYYSVVSLENTQNFRICKINDQTPEKMFKTNSHC